ncbi:MULTISPECIES: hypothetical protein [unclassified Rhodococcus (in: high G+C Gram-positive bacteria)]|uniref:hypothetical protein n=1 Tax=unclassified Rhodococcus (in: high G+C Gram-positive bacteria) TaxID=192944 RepID=UPI001179B19F|nr:MULTISPECIES: hypothetical protein [unclassified Rhodococcus (in: high G+C Gram-positive bacteria)]
MANTGNQKVVRWLAGGAVVLLCAVVGVWGIIAGWGVDVWSVVGTWVASVGTVAAVVVALLQSAQAREDAEAGALEAERLRVADADAADARLVRELDAVRERAREDRDAAQLRLEAELARSEELLTRELDAQRRQEQVATLPPIFEAIAEVAGFPWTEFKALKKHAGWRAQNTPLNAQQVAQNISDAGRPWLLRLVALELVFTPAFVTLVEPEVERAVRTLYVDYRAVVFMASEALDKLVGGLEEPDFEAISEQFSKIHGQRKPLINLVRQQMLGLGPIVDPSTEVQTTR